MASQPPAVVLGRVAAIDCGTNSLRLLVADLDPDALGLHELTRQMEIVRLGQDIDRTGRIAPEAMRRALRVLDRYGQTCRELGVSEIRFVATSASRDADNATEFVAGVRAAFPGHDVTPQVVTGTEEAELSFLGATGALAAGGLRGPYLVVDLGGGSTEFILGDTAPQQMISTDIGSVRLTERHFATDPPTWDPPTADQIEAATADIDAALARVAQAVDLTGADHLVGLAGTVTTLVAHALRLPSYQRERVHLASLPVAEMRDACTDVLGMTREQRVALPYLHPGRVDVIAAGALIWRRIVERVSADSALTHVLASENDILDGVALSLHPRYRDLNP